MRRRSIVALGLGAPSSACPVALRLTVVALLLLLLAAAASAQDKTVDSSPPGENVPPSGTVAHAQAGAEPSAPPSPSAPAANEDTATAAEAERREAEERNTLTRALHLQQLAEAKDKVRSDPLWPRWRPLASFASETSLILAHYVFQHFSCSLSFLLKTPHRVPSCPPPRHQHLSPSPSSPSSLLLSFSLLILLSPLKSFPSSS